MPKSKEQKNKLIDKYAKHIEKAKALYIIDPGAITANESTELRKSLTPNKGVFKIIKNTLFQIALKKANKEIEDYNFSSKNAVIFSEENVSENAKIVYEFLKDNKKGEIRIGILHDDTLTAKEVERLAKLPSREVVLTQTVSTLAAPIKSFVTALEGNIKNFVYVLNNLKESKA